MGLFSKLTGGNPNKQGDALMYVFGRDQHFCRTYVDARGSHFQNDERLLAYYSSPGCLGEHRQKVNGRVRPLRPVTIAYELITGLWTFPMLDWHEKITVEKGHSESDMVLDNGFAEGFAEAAQKQEKAAWMGKLTTILLLAVVGFLLIVLLIGMQTGVISNFLAAIPKFLTGG